MLWPEGLVLFRVFSFENWKWKIDVSFDTFGHIHFWSMCAHCSSVSEQKKSMYTEFFFFLPYVVIKSMRWESESNKKRSRRRRSIAKDFIVFASGIIMKNEWSQVIKTTWICQTRAMLGRQKHDFHDVRICMRAFKASGRWESKCFWDRRYYNGSVPFNNSQLKWSLVRAFFFACVCVCSLLVSFDFREAASTVWFHCFSVWVHPMPSIRSLFTHLSNINKVSINQTLFMNLSLSAAPLYIHI